MSFRLGRPAQHGGIDLVGDRGHEHIGRPDGLGEFLRRRLVLEIEARVEQFAQARLDHVGQAAGDDDDRSLLHRFKRPRMEKAAKCKEFHALLTLTRRSKVTTRRVAVSVKLLYQSLNPRQRHYPGEPCARSSLPLLLSA